MTPTDFKIISDELYPFRVNDKVTSYSEWKWLESKGAGKIIIHLGKEHFAVNPETYLTYSKKLSEWWKHQGKISYAKQKSLEDLEKTNETCPL